ncbi:hypothetical protein SAMN05661091_2159 [Paenibacillus uliginis N3/975]|uniref:Uncharacterized protein n=1 Tax=Paenibacillus uliginis N3/975 TaxID=1313296 RepID=A0A1X7H9Q6_9BACL|nr:MULTISPECIES: hypothetical protein [Paenibacillus]UNK16567.1 hypothetical protein MNQ98_18940 [Paenibacillus sp. N3/727]SMF82322.1 hypothetical protein SAMN05661091_2159 [Paenibacillus uliginis N3/975]
MATERLPDIDRFLNLVGHLEERIHLLIEKTSLSEQEKKFIWDHIMVVPGKNDDL